MTNKYGQVALLAVGRSLSGSPNPKDHWELSTEVVFPNSPTSQRKSCPKGAFLGLCEAGLVKGISAGNYTKSKDNKRYAITAVELLRVGNAPPEPRALWDAVMSGERKAHNSQMDIVMALWKNGLLVRM